MQKQLCGLCISKERKSVVVKSMLEIWLAARKIMKEFVLQPHKISLPHLSNCSRSAAPDMELV